MPKKENAITRVGGVDPSFLKHYVDTDKSLEAMAEYVVLPFIKRVQPTSAQELKEQFGEGALLSSPGNVLLLRYLKENAPGFNFVPLFFYVEFCKWAAIGDKDNPMIIARTFDPKHDIALCSRDSARRYEVYPGQENKKPEDQQRFRYIEHLCFVVLIYDKNHEQNNLEITLTFDRGEFYAGKNFITAARARRQEIEIEGEMRHVPVPLWAQVWNVSPIFRNPDTKKKWYGYNVRAPFEDIGPVIASEDADRLKARHDELRLAHEKGRIVTNIEGDDEEPTIPSETEM